MKGTEVLAPTIPVNPSQPVYFEEKQKRKVEDTWKVKKEKELCKVVDMT